MNRLFLALSALPLLLAVGCTSTSTAPARFFSDRPAFLGAVKPTGEVTFTAGHSNRADRLTDYSTPQGLTLGGVRFTGPSPSCGFGLCVITPCDAFRSGWEGNPMALNGPSDGAIMLYPPPRTVAIGVEAYTVSGDQPRPYGQTIRLTTSAGEKKDLPTQEKPTLAFLGVSSGQPLEWIKLETLTGKHNPQLTSVVYTVQERKYWPWQW
jgi:hypothetical protein